MQRIQRKRIKGYKQPKGTKYVGRPTKFGNPFRLTDSKMIQYYDEYIGDWLMLLTPSSDHSINDIIILYEKWIRNELYIFGYNFLKPPTKEDIDELGKYKYLSCFCPLSEPCHVDVLIKILNL